LDHANHIHSSFRKFRFLSRTCASPSTQNGPPKCRSHKISAGPSSQILDNSRSPRSRVRNLNSGAASPACSLALTLRSIRPSVNPVVRPGCLIDVRFPSSLR
jgi:hypothetical protein